MSCSSASVGLWPSERMTVPSSFVVIEPSPSLSNSENASLNSAGKVGHVHEREMCSCSSEGVKNVTRDVRDSCTDYMHASMHYAQPPAGARVQNFNNCNLFSNFVRASICALHAEC